jgi:hypothetical protein
MSVCVVAANSSMAWFMSLRKRVRGGVFSMMPVSTSEAGLVVAALGREEWGRGEGRGDDEKSKCNYLKLLPIE